MWYSDDAGFFMKLAKGLAENNSHRGYVRNSRPHGIGSEDGGGVAMDTGARYPWLYHSTSRKLARGRDGRSGVIHERADPSLEVERRARPMRVWLKRLGPALY